MHQRTPKPQLFDDGGRAVVLDAKLGGGGEGDVYAVASQPGVAAKLYTQAPDAEKAAKIAAMALLANERLHNICAWPLGSLRRAPGGAVVGFTMPLFAGYRPAFNLYSPKLRLQEFPKAGWAFIVHAAGNAARAFRVVHEAGQVIGDVNHGNMFIASNATVRLIDCDSFQITTSGKRWYCEVGVSTHVPPELQGTPNFKGVVRTANHDNFGLAVVVFQLLFMARHPFSGMYLGRGDMPLEQAIKEYRFAYGSMAAAKQMKAPPGSLGLNGVTPAMALMFERAFSEQGSRDGFRPTADEWIGALGDLAKQIRKCPANPAHEYYGGLARCPWCDIETASGAALFPVVFVTGATGGGVDVAALWQRIQATPDPGPAADIQPPASVRASDPARALGRTFLFRKLAAIALGIGAVFGSTQLLSGPPAFWGMLAAIAAAFAIALAGVKERRAPFQKAAQAAGQRWDELKARWETEASHRPFAAERARLAAFKTQYDQLPQERARRLAELDRDRRASQLRAHLDRCRIDQAKIDGIGAARKATLMSHGIETALDIDNRVLAVPGFGPKRFSRLVEWRRKQEARFRFDPAKGADPAERAAVERDIAATRSKIEQALQKGAAQLAAMSQNIVARRTALRGLMDQAAADLAKANADWRAVG